MIFRIPEQYEVLAQHGEAQRRITDLGGNTGRVPVIDEHSGRPGSLKSGEYISM